MKINNNTMPKEERILSSCIQHSAELEGKIPVRIDITEWEENEFSASISFEIEGDYFGVRCPESYGSRATKPHIISKVNKLLKVLGYTGEEVEE